jgi:hypothetical protein
VNAPVGGSCMEDVHDVLFIATTLVSFAALALLTGILARRLGDDR